MCIGRQSLRRRSRWWGDFLSVRLSVPLRPHTSAFQLEGAGPATPLGRRHGRQQTRRQIVRILFRSYPHVRDIILVYKYIYIKYARALCSLTIITQ